MKKYWKWAFLALPLTLLLPASCDKEPKEEPYCEPYEKELFFNEDNVDSIQPAVLKHFAKDKACTHIYMHIMDDNNYTSATPSATRKYLQDRLNISSKISGRGDFYFNPGSIAQADSIWFVNNGWTVNKRYWQR